MAQHTKRPGTDADAGPSDMFFGGNSTDDTAALAWAQAIQRLRLQREHGLSADLAAVVADFAYGEVAA